MILLLISNIQKFLLNRTLRSAHPYVLSPPGPYQPGLGFTSSSENGVVTCIRKPSYLKDLTQKTASHLWASWSDVLAGQEGPRKGDSTWNCWMLNAKTDGPSLQRSTINSWFGAWNETCLVLFQIYVLIVGLVPDILLDVTIVCACLEQKQLIFASHVFYEPGPTHWSSGGVLRSGSAFLSLSFPELYG